MRRNGIWRGADRLCYAATSREGGPVHDADRARPDPGRILVAELRPRAGSRPAAAVPARRIALLAGLSSADAGAVAALAGQRPRLSRTWPLRAAHLPLPRPRLCGGC